MGKIKDYIKKHKKSLENKLLIGGVVIVGSVIGSYGAFRTNIKMVQQTFIVSNYDVGKGYVFTYNAEESGRESLSEYGEGYKLFVSTEEVDGKFKPRVMIRLEDLGENHPLKNKLFHLKNIEMSEQRGEMILRETREKYREHIPFKKIIDKINE